METFQSFVQRNPEEFAKAINDRVFLQARKYVYGDDDTQLLNSFIGCPRYLTLSLRCFGGMSYGKPLEIFTDLQQLRRHGAESQ